MSARHTYRPTRGRPRNTRSPRLRGPASPWTSHARRARRIAFTAQATERLLLHLRFPVHHHVRRPDRLTLERSHHVEDLPVGGDLEVGARLTRGEEPHRKQRLRDHDLERTGG